MAGVQGVGVGAWEQKEKRKTLKIKRDPGAEWVLIPLFLRPAANLPLQPTRQLVRIIAIK